MPAPVRGAAVIQRGTVTTGGTVEATVTIAGDTWTLPTIAPVTTGQDVTVLWAGRQGVILAGGGGAPVAGINIPFDESEGLAAQDTLNDESIQLNEAVQWQQPGMAGDGGTAALLVAGGGGTYSRTLALDGSITVDVWLAGAENGGDTDSVCVYLGPVYIGTNGGRWYFVANDGFSGDYFPPNRTAPVHVIASYDTSTGAWAVSFNGDTRAGTATPSGPVAGVTLEIGAADNGTAFDNLVVTGDFA